MGYMAIFYPKLCLGSRVIRIYKGIAVRSLHPDVQKRARLKLMVLDATESLDDPGSQRGNQLHMLRGSRQGQYSIRVNSQWRICFFWRNGGAHEVEVVDYH